MNEVVSNPTNEDLSIDTVINSLFEAEESKVAEVADVPEVKEEVKEVSEAVEEVAEPDAEFSIPNNVPKELQEAIDGLEDVGVKKATLDIFKKMQGNFTKKNQEFSEQKKLAESIDEAFKMIEAKRKAK